MRFEFGSGGKRGLRGECGATAVEFAMLLPLMLLAVFGIMAFGNLYYQLNIVNSGAREAARRAAIIPGTTKESMTNTLQTQYGALITVDSIDYGTDYVTAQVSQPLTLEFPYLTQYVPNFPTVATGKCVMWRENH